MPLLLLRDSESPDVIALRKALATQMGEDFARFAGDAKGDHLDAALEALIRQWQSRVGIIADGIVGPRCQTLLGLRQSGGLLETLPVDVVRSLFPATKPANVVRYYPYVAAALEALNLADRTMVLSALGTIRVESEGFVPIAEMPSQFNTPSAGAPFSLYDNRKDLGNAEVGDGAAFKGRGFVQLTGRANYASYGAKLGIALVANRDLANMPEVAAVLLAQCLADRARDIRAAVANREFAKARKLVNGGSNGLDRFKAVFALAEKTWPVSAKKAPVVSDRTASRAGRVKSIAVTPSAAPKRTLTVNRDPADVRDRTYNPPPVCLEPRHPTDVDIKTKLGRYVHARLILDQGEEGACTGFGLACVINFLRWRLAGFDERIGSVSPRMLYTFARRYDEYAGEDYEGSSCRGALKGWFNHGVCLESDWPYQDPSRMPAYGYADRAAHNTLGAYYRIDLTLISDLQAAIQQVGAVYVSAYTHSGWDDVAASQAPKSHDELPRIAFNGRPSKSGGHAFALVGYN